MSSAEELEKCRRQIEAMVGTADQVMADFHRELEEVSKALNMPMLVLLRYLLADAREIQDGVFDLANSVGPRRMIGIAVALGVSDYMQRHADELLSNGLRFRPGR